MEHRVWATVSGIDTAVLGNSIALGNVASTTITSFLNSGIPDYARNILITPIVSTGSIANGSAIISGLNARGQPITETIAISAQQSTTAVGSKAFKQITSIFFPATSGANAQIKVGVGSKLGLIHCMTNAGDYDWDEFNGAYQATRGTMLTNPTELDLNEFVPNTTITGPTQIDLWYVQNFRCY
jgi:hypothetical protein